MKQEEYAIINNSFEYDNRIYDCSCAIERDIPIIIQEAENSHNDSFNELYDKQSLRAEKVRIFLDENNKPIFGIVIYFIDYKDSDWKRSACGGYYPFCDDKLFPHPYQESICW